MAIIILFLYYYCLGIVKSKPNGSQTILKSMQNKRIPNKGPFMANVPVQLMVQNYKDVSKYVGHESVSPPKVCLMKNTLIRVNVFMFYSLNIFTIFLSPPFFESQIM